MSELSELSSVSALIGLKRLYQLQVGGMVAMASCLAARHKVVTEASMQLVFRSSSLRSIKNAESYLLFIHHHIFRQGKVLSC